MHRSRPSCERKSTGTAHNVAHYASSMVARNCSALKSVVTRASPIPRSKTSRSVPSNTFLSTAISSSQRSVGIDAGGCTGSPKLCSKRRMRATVGWSIQPMRRDRSAAMTMPTATASPCSQLP